MLQSLPEILFRIVTEFQAVSMINDVAKIERNVGIKWFSTNQFRQFMVSNILRYITFKEFY